MNNHVKNILRLCVHPQAIDKATFQSLIEEVIIENDEDSICELQKTYDSSLQSDRLNFKVFHEVWRACFLNNQLNHQLKEQKFSNKNKI